MGQIEKDASNNSVAIGPSSASCYLAMTGGYTLPNLCLAMTRGIHIQTQNRWEGFMESLHHDSVLYSGDKNQYILTVQDSDLESCEECRKWEPLKV
jgi:hypothetical protein